MIRPTESDRSMNEPIISVGIWLGAASGAAHGGWSAQRRVSTRPSRGPGNVDEFTQGGNQAILICMSPYSENMTKAHCQWEIRLLEFELTSSF